jgi:hypothetical protein
MMWMACAPEAASGRAHWRASLHKPSGASTLSAASAGRARLRSRELASPTPGISISSLLSRVKPTAAGHCSLLMMDEIGKVL